MSEIVISRRTPPFTVVQDGVYRRHDLSLPARHILGWMLGRDDKYKLNVGYLCKLHGLTENVWLRIRGELTKAGFYSSARVKVADGRFKWIHKITDEPLYEHVPSNEVAPAPAPAPAPVPAPAAAAAATLDRFVVPGALEKHRAAIRAAARQARLDVKQTQALADELVGRLLDASADPLNMPAAWLRRAAASVDAGEISRWQQAGAAHRLSHKPSRPQQQQQEQSARRISREDLDAMIKSAIQNSVR